MEEETSAEDTGEGIEHVQVLQPGEVNNQGETITLSLEDAAQFIFQQQGLQGDGEGRLQPGTYQIITQQLTSSADGQLTVALTDGINVIHTTDPDQLNGFDIGNQSLILQSGNDDESLQRRIVQLPEGAVIQSFPGMITQGNDEGSTSFVTSDSTEPLPDSANVQMKREPGQEEFDGQSESVLQIDLPVSQSENILQMINQTSLPLEVTQEQNLKNDIESTVQISLASDMTFSTDSSYTQSLLNMEEIKGSNTTGVVSTLHGASSTGQARESDASTKQLTSDEEARGADGYSTENVTTDPAEVAKDLTGIVVVKKEKEPDLTKPIEVTDHMEVMINGKKCLLKVNPDTGQLCAYPLISTTSSGKRRGRPRKSEMQQKDEDESSINVSGIETDQTNSAAEGLLELSNTGPDGVRRSGRSRKKARTLQDYEMLEVSSDDDAAADDAEDEVLPSGAVRKRKLLQKDYLPVTPIAVPVKRGRGRPRRYPRPDETPVSTQIPAMIIPSTDGQTIMMAPIQGLTNLEAFQEQVKNMPMFQQQQPELTDDASQYFNTANVLDLGDGTQVSIQMSTGDGATAEMGVTDALDADTANSTEVSEAGLASSTDTLQATMATNDLLDTVNENSVSADGNKMLSSTEETQPTIIQIPENLLPMFMQKKDPIKIGLKASEVHLEKLRCSKCGFQAYYEQQYQHHILTHTEEVTKCKCCNFVAFDKDDILAHFKTNHPRCICTVCDHMAEHAYIIKRHMMRHSQEGCKCDICGKVYKDQYVLKMHVKMVHLPAEVLFECTICSKKFTRKAHLKRHLRIHDPEKPFKCPHCLYRGCERSDISKHLLIHEEPKHVCEVCGKAFRHVKNKELHLKRHNGQRDYKCGVCDFYGYTFTDIRKHIERKHTDTKTFICDKCGSAFKSDILLREHKSQQCEVFMIEQALAIATSDGGTSQATIQIPSNYSLDGQHIQIDGNNHIALDNQGHITIEHVNLSEEGGIGLTEEQLQAVVSHGQMTDTELQAVVSNGQIIESELQAVVSQGHLTDTELQSLVNQGQISDTGQCQSEMIQEMTGAGVNVSQVQYTGVARVVGVDDMPLTEEDEEEEEEEEEEGEDMEEDELDDEEDEDLNENMDDIVGEVSGVVGENKQHIVNVNDQMLGMVQIIR